MTTIEINGEQIPAASPCGGTQMKTIADLESELMEAQTVINELQGLRLYQHSKKLETQLAEAQAMVKALTEPVDWSASSREGVHATWEAEWITSFAQRLVAAFHEMGGENYLELTFNHPEDGQFSVLVQKKAGKTPADIKMELEAQLAEAKAARSKLQAELVDRSRQVLNSRHRAWADNDTIRTLRTQLAEAKAWKEAAIENAECVHCGASLKGEDELSHWERCPNHPARTQVKRLVECLSIIKDQLESRFWDEAARPGTTAWCQALVSMAEKAIAANNLQPEPSDETL